MFGKETDIKREDINFPNWFYFDLTEWVPDNDMTDEQKKEHDDYKTTKGFLLTYGYKEAWRNSFDKETNLGEIRMALALPNFDYLIFEEITGISKQDFENKLSRNKTCEHKKDSNYCPNCGIKLKR